MIRFSLSVFSFFLWLDHDISVFSLTVVHRTTVGKLKMIDRFREIEFHVFMSDSSFSFIFLFSFIFFEFFKRSCSALNYFRVSLKRNSIFNWIKVCTFFFFCNFVFIPLIKFVGVPDCFCFLNKNVGIAKVPLQRNK